MSYMVSVLWACLIVVCIAFASVFPHQANNAQLGHTLDVIAEVSGKFDIKTKFGIKAPHTRCLTWIDGRLYGRMHLTNYCAKVQLMSTCINKNSSFLEGNLRLPCAATAWKAACLCKVASVFEHIFPMIPNGLLPNVKLTQGIKCALGQGALEFCLSGWGLSWSLCILS